MRGHLKDRRHSKEREAFLTTITSSTKLIEVLSDNIIRVYNWWNIYFIDMSRPSRDSISLFQMSKLMSESLLRVTVLASLVYS